MNGTLQLLGDLKTRQQYGVFSLPGLLPISLPVLWLRF
jgi:hypothetical protein